MKIQFFNYKHLAAESKGDCSKFIELLYYSTPLTDAYSFILNPNLFFRNKENASLAERCMYLKLASYRSYFEYKQHEVLYLPTSIAAKHFDINRLQLNKLLQITTNKIYFRYEENYNG